MENTTMLRVIQVMTNDFGAYNYGKPSKVTESVFWTGTDLDELSRLYPPTNIWRADLLGHSEIEDGLIRFDYRFERWSLGEWEVIEDPRRRISPEKSIHERETEAENRRDFPEESDFPGYEDDLFEDDPDEIGFDLE